MAALLALAFTALLWTAAARLAWDGGSQPSTPQTQVTVPYAKPVAIHAATANASSWLQPLATPTPLLEAATDR